ncbi:ATP-binding protein [Neptunicoccus cionae]|uniref:ATP-binding protein n=1 Tax=Neptunicoccus cionae TaxID=2035344 RepID=UPI000C780291|nr:ATP-binding protein [Amylibacter cionae]PLS22511.1 ATPase [Amylibacter cionae]
MISKRGSFWLQCVVIGFCLLASALATVTVKRIADHKSEENFSVIIEQAVTSLRRTREIYERTLGGLAGLFIASDNISYVEMDDYASAINIRENQSGINAIGFASHPSPDSDSLIVQRIRPRTPGDSVIGTDFNQYPDVIAAAKKSRESGQLTLVPNIELPIDGELVSKGIILRPVTRSARNETDGTLRPAEFLGYVFAIMDMDSAFDTLSPAQNELVELRVWFTKGNTDAPPLYQNITDAQANPAPKFQRVMQVEGFGQPMRLQWNGSSKFDYIQPFRAHWILLALCLSLTALIFMILRFMNRRERTITRLVEEKSNELATRETERRSIIENAMLAIVSTDADGRILQVNDAAQTLLLTPKTVGLETRNIAEVLPGLDPREPDSRFKLTLPATEYSNGETILEVEKNTWLTSGSEIRVTLLMRDITKRERQARQIAKMEERWNLALIGAQIGVFDIDLEKNTSVVSKMWRMMMNITSSSDPSDPYKDLLDHIHPDDRANLIKAHRACIDGDTDRAEARFRVSDSGSDWRWIQSDAVVVEWDDDGQALRMIGTQVDITDRIRVERMKQDFVATVSHELRTPLTSIKGSLGLLEAQLKDTQLPVASRLVEIAQSNSERLYNLVNDILDMEKMNAGQMQIDAKEECLSKLLVLVSDQIAPYAAQCGVGLDVSIPKGNYRIWTDQKRIIQVLTNLLSNACKFSDKGTRVRLSAQLLSGEVRIAVTNFGPGIPEEFHNRIFQPFAQADTKANKKKVGTGLGLNISRHLVESMGGTIGFKSIPNEKTIFWFTCPLADDTDTGGDEPGTEDIDQLRAVS